MVEPEGCPERGVSQPVKERVRMGIGQFLYVWGPHQRFYGQRVGTDAAESGADYFGRNSLGRVAMRTTAVAGA